MLCETRGQFFTVFMVLFVMIMLNVFLAILNDGAFSASPLSHYYFCSVDEWFLIFSQPL